MGQGEESGKKNVNKVKAAEADAMEWKGKTKEQEVEMWNLENVESQEFSRALKKYSRSTRGGAGSISQQSIFNALATE